jgi:hypothetical protein
MLKISVVYNPTIITAYPSLRLHTSLMRKVTDCRVDKTANLVRPQPLSCGYEIIHVFRTVHIPTALRTELLDGWR